MHIQVVSEPSLTNITIRHLNKTTEHLKNNSEFYTVSNWFELIVNYPGYKIEIKDIKINGESILHTLYLGTFIQKKDSIRHYCPSLWEAGVFSIWLHPNLGHYFMSVFSQINNGDYGKNINDLYLHTVDRPLQINSKYPEHIRSYFANGYGPRWWSLTDRARLPYQILDIQNVDRNRLLKELKQLPHHMEYRPGWNAITWQRRGEIGLPATEFNDISHWPEIVNTLKSAGYTSMINANWLGLDAGNYLQMHRDDIQNVQQMAADEALHFQGCVRFYWSLVHTDGFYFKMGEAGLLPVDQPMLINPTRYAHCVINDSDVQRESMQAWGIFDK